MTVSVRLAPGDGWLARRDDGVLFTKEEWSEGLDAFMGATSVTDARESVTSAVVSAAFEVPAFVMVTLSDALECVVFGDLAVHTEDPSAPMLSAAGSSTWIERRLKLGDRAIRVWAGEPAVARARLDAGVVFAGGFELVAGETVAQDGGSHASPAVDELEAPPILEAPEPEPVGTSLPPPVIAPVGVPVANVVLPDHSIVPITGTVVFGRNPDRTVARVGEDARLVVLETSTSVSRTHLTIRLEGSTLTATDCGSRGGVVIVTPGREPVMLESWIAQEVVPGDTIYLGGPLELRIAAAGTSDED